MQDEIFLEHGRYLRTFQCEISSPRTQVSFQFFAICIILNIYKRFMFKKLGNKNKNFRRSSTLRISNRSLERVNRTKLLGIHVSEHLYWEEHVHKLSVLLQCAWYFTEN